MIHTERKKLNVVDILVSLNFIHMKMCSSFFCCDGKFIIGSLRFLLRIWFEGIFMYLLRYSGSFCSFKNNFPRTAWINIIFFRTPKMRIWFRFWFPGKLKIHKKGKFARSDLSPGREMFSISSDFPSIERKAFLQQSSTSLSRLSPGFERRHQRLLLFKLDSRKKENPPIWDFPPGRNNVKKSTI